MRPDLHLRASLGVSPALVGAVLALVSAVVLVVSAPWAASPAVASDADARLAVPAGPAASPSAAPTDASLAGPVVRAVLFFSPTCPHCETVIKEHLPGIFERFGGEPRTSIDRSVALADVAFYLMQNGMLQLLMVDVSAEAGARMFVADSERLGVEQSVPRLDIADEHLRGSVDIPARLPDIIATALGADGLDWPPVPELSAAIAPFPEAGGEQAGTTTVAGAADQVSAADLPVWDRVSRDLLANIVAIGVLVLLVASLFAAPVLAHHGRLAPLARWRRAVPLVASAGLAIAVYLGYTASNDLDAVCGPVGDCLTVQASDYALLFGALPTWLLGVIGYAIVLAGSLMAGRLRPRGGDAAQAAVAATAYVGTLFSAWLTFLEPFVIGATCIWCISSALTMLALLWLTAGDGLAALRRLVSPGTPAVHA